jgi:hypothetical protein
MIASTTRGLLAISFSACSEIGAIHEQDLFLQPFCISEQIIVAGSQAADDGIERGLKNRNDERNGNDYLCQDAGPSEPSWHFADGT